MAYDVEAIKLANPISSVVQSRIQLKRSGKEFTACCPFHNEKTPSFTVVPAKELFHCFGCGESGDQIDFVMKYDAVDFKTACQILGGETQPPSAKTRIKRQAKVIASIYDGITPVSLIPAEAPRITAGVKTPPIYNPKREHDTHYTPTMVFEYKDSNGHLVGYVLRVEFDDKKITPTVMWCKWGDKAGWCHFAFPEPRTLYGIDKRTLNPDAPVMVVEGERAADAAHKLLPAYTVVTWAGGTNAVRKANWEALRGCNAVLWPDADEQGVKAMGEVAEILHGLGCKVKVIEVTG